MKTTPLFIRILGGALLCVLWLVSFFHPLLTQGECVSLIGLSHIGKPYVFGAEGPDAYDCSGLTRSAYAYFDTDMIHSAQFVAYDEQYQTVEDTKNLVPGDLIFFDTVRDKDKCDHVGIWLGMNRFVHASSSEMVVMVSDFDEKWQKCYSWGKHIIDSSPCALLAQIEL